MDGAKKVIPLAVLAKRKKTKNVRQDWMYQLARIRLVVALQMHRLLALAKGCVYIHTIVRRLSFREGRAFSDINLQGSEGQNKDCPCFQYIQDSPPYAPFSLQELADQQALLAQLVAAPSVSTTSSASSSPASTATGALTCSENSVASVPAQMIETTGNVTPNQLLYTLRQVLCTNACNEPAGIPTGVAWSTGTKTAGDCELSVAVAGGIEAVSFMVCSMETHLPTDLSSTCTEAQLQ